MDYINTFKKEVIDVYNKTIDLINSNHLHVFTWEWNKISDYELLTYETLDDYIADNAVFPKTTDYISVADFVSACQEPESNIRIITDKELNKEREFYKNKREELLNKFGTLEEIKRKMDQAKEKSEKAFQEYHELNKIVRGY